MASPVSEIRSFHKIIEDEANGLEFGLITVNVYLKNGVPVLNTLSLVTQKRIKFNKKPIK
jgi:hypothetical protein